MSVDIMAKNANRMLHAPESIHVAVDLPDTAGIHIKQEGSEMVFSEPSML